MASNSAEYMRKYRAKQKAAVEVVREAAQEVVDRVGPLQARVAELEDEVRQLKMQLAKRPRDPEPTAGAVVPAAPAPPARREAHGLPPRDSAFGFSRPVPKPSAKAAKKV